MPYSRKHSRSSTPARFARKTRTAKKTYSKYGKQKKAAATVRRRTAAAKPGSKRIKRTVLSNARQIASLKDAKYGPVQVNHSKMNDECIVVDTRPVCLHLNNLMTYGDNTSWIKPKLQLVGEPNNYMDDFNRVCPFYTKDGIQTYKEVVPQPEGPEILWKSTILRFRFSGWVERKHMKVLIVKQKIGREISDPWRVHASESPHPHYMPYTLPQFRRMCGPMAPNWLDRGQYEVIASKSIYLNSVPEIPPHSVLHQTADTVADMAGITQHETGREATTGPVRYCNIKITPNMVMKQIVTTQGPDGEDVDANVNPAEDKTEGPYSYDNLPPRQNLWCIVMSDDGGADTLTPNHRTTFMCERTNVFRDLAANRAKAVKAANFNPGAVLVKTLADGTDVDENGRILGSGAPAVPVDPIPFEGGDVERASVTDWYAYYQAQVAYYTLPENSAINTGDVPNLVVNGTPRHDNWSHTSGLALTYYSFLVSAGANYVFVP